MATLILAFLTILSGFSTFAKQDGEAKVRQLTYQMMPANDVDMIKRLAKCGISGVPIAIIRDPLREGVEGIYLFVEKFDPNVICQERAFIFLRDRAFRKRLADLFDKNTSLVLGLREDSPYAGIALGYPDFLAQGIRAGLGIESNESDILILSRWSSIYNYITIEQQLFAWHMLADALEKSLKGVKVSQETYAYLKDFIADARAIDATLRELENAGDRTEYMLNEENLVEAVSEPDAYRQYLKERMLGHIQLRATTLISDIKRLAPNARQFRQLLGTVNSLVPSKIMQHIGVNTLFDFDLKSATCVVQLTQAREDTTAPGKQ